MKILVGTSPVEFDLDPFKDKRDSGVVLLVQNLGPGSIYLDNDPDVSPETGLKIGVNCGYEFPRLSERALYVVADTGDTDVRYFGVD